MKTFSPRILWLIPIATLIHAIEEILTFPNFSIGQEIIHRPFPIWAFAFSALAMSATGFVVVALANRRTAKPVHHWTAIALGYSLAMLANAVISHLMGAAMLGRYVPGLASGLALNLPINAFILTRAYQLKAIPRATFLRWSLPTLPALMALTALYFEIGSRLFVTHHP